ncbi:hypothetical protein OSB04_024319 [Centaurea solstitialis]|uniref:Uncharacterized protein n=1 Tax=Centaurea solstitialis TaxID=347529 RepID=A0AA38W0I3_9ASTR|nr:hypothetical protein OSB04_024319 [Centaurea solstitialis]
MSSVKEGKKECLVKFGGNWTGFAMSKAKGSGIKVLIPSDDLTELKKKRFNADRLARSFMIRVLPNDTSIDTHNNIGKEIWDEIEKHMMGTSVGTQVKVTRCIKRYECLKAKESELLEATYERFCNLLYELKKEILEEKKTDDKVSVDSLAIMSEKKGKYVSKSSRRKKSESSNDSDEDCVSNAEMDELKHAMAMITKTL